MECGGDLITMKNNLQENLAKLDQYRFQGIVSKAETKPLVTYDKLDESVEETKNKQIIYLSKPIKNKSDPPVAINSSPTSNYSAPEPYIKPVLRTPAINPPQMISAVSNFSNPKKSPPISNPDSASKIMTDSSKFKQGFNWDNDIFEINSQVFKNSSFRENQVEIINAVLSLRDVFVIMPTGGGKSLTFQLPAILSPGVSIVIMPLISLIYDQLNRLKDLKIGARELNSSQNIDEQNQIFDDIITSNNIKILFATPEKLSKSNKLNWFLQKLQERDKLSRFVIDEAHCVSQWGRDFRKDYMKLFKLRDSFPNVPILALTGTATEKVTEDVVKNLKMKDPLVFKSSFNRPNLIYEVRAKTKNTIEDIFNLIQQKFSNDSGLIYCSTKKDCEKVVKKLKEFKVSVEFFHSEVSAQDKTRIQNGWMRGNIKVLVATVAFGMGIDKQAVRFVFHYSIPKSLEGYYQESGRAGRDGKESLCVIYYKYSDKMKLEYLIGMSSEEVQQDNNFQELQSIIAYCEDIYTCRRQQQLAYFNEDFNPSRCNKTCDNCANNYQYDEIDVTNLVKKIIEVLNTNRESINTLNQITFFIKGKKSGKKDLSHKPDYGICKNEDPKLLDQTLIKMVQLGILKEKVVKLYKNNTMTKIELGPAWYKVSRNQMEVKVKIGRKLKPKIKEVSKPDQKKIFNSKYFDDVFGTFEVQDFNLGPKDIIMSNPDMILEKENNGNIEEAGHLCTGKENDDNMEGLDQHIGIGKSGAIENFVYENEDIRGNFRQSHSSLKKSQEPSDYFRSDLYYPEIDYEEYLANENMELSNPLKESFDLYGKAGSSDLFEEIRMRLVMIREKIAKKNQKRPMDVLDDEELVKLCKELPGKGSLSPEFYQEIAFFKSMNDIKDNFGFTLDLDTSEIISFLQPSTDSLQTQHTSEKRIKNSK